MKSSHFQQEGFYMLKDEFNIEYFKSIREEINMRVKIHYQLVLSKFAFGGGLLAFMLTNKLLLPLSPFAVTACFFMLIDIAILENLGWIRSAGAFVRKNIEDTELQIIKWETGFTQTDGIWSCFNMFGYLAGVWLVAPVMVVIAFLSEYDPNNKPAIALFVVTCYLIAYSFCLVIQNLHEDKAKAIENQESPLIEKPGNRRS
jgi:hypothetical protein